MVKECDGGYTGTALPNVLGSGNDDYVVGTITSYGVPIVPDHKTGTQPFITSVTDLTVQVPVSIEHARMIIVIAEKYIEMNTYPFGIDTR